MWLCWTTGINGPPFWRCCTCGGFNHVRRYVYDVSDDFLNDVHHSLFVRRSAILGNATAATKGNFLSASSLPGTALLGSRITHMVDEASRSVCPDNELWWPLWERWQERMWNEKGKLIADILWRN